VSGRFLMRRLFRMAGIMMFMQLLGSVRALEFMALAGNARQRNGHKKQGKKFHRRAS
jgi:hypothetical protein